MQVPAPKDHDIPPSHVWCHQRAERARKLPAPTPFLFVAFGSDSKLELVLYVHVIMMVHVRRGLVGCHDVPTTARAEGFISVSTHRTKMGTMDKRCGNLARVGPLIVHTDHHWPSGASALPISFFSCKGFDHQEKRALNVHGPVRYKEGLNRGERTSQPTNILQLAGQVTPRSLINWRLEGLPSRAASKHLYLLKNPAR